MKTNPEQWEIEAYNLYQKKEATDLYDDRYQPTPEEWEIEAYNLYPIEDEAYLFDDRYQAPPTVYIQKDNTEQ